jgi:hypothetical protein
MMAASWLVCGPRPMRAALPQSTLPCGPRPRTRSVRQFACGSGTPVCSQGRFEVVASRGRITEGTACPSQEHSSRSLPVGQATLHGQRLHLARELDNLLRLEHLGSTCFANPARRNSKPSRSTVTSAKWYTPAN